VISRPQHGDRIDMFSVVEMTEEKVGMITYGPWKVKYEPGEQLDGSYTVGHDDGSPQCARELVAAGLTKDNAALIAEIPELVTLLEVLIRDYETPTEGYQYPLSELIAEARTRLTKVGVLK
jgi:hypothetical protein